MDKRRKNQIATTLHMQSRQCFCQIKPQGFKAIQLESSEEHDIPLVDMNENSSNPPSRLNPADIEAETIADSNLTISTSSKLVQFESKHPTMGWATSSAADQSSAVMTEPMRRLRPSNGPAPKPKRFFRTFWRGLAARAMALDVLNNSMNE